MHICWMTINVSDLAASKAFYGDFLGLKLERQFSPNPDMTIAFMADDGGTQIELIQGAGQAPANGRGISIGMRTDAFDAMLDRAKARGLCPSDPVTMGGMECFFLKDPSGVGVQVIRGA